MAVAWYAQLALIPIFVGVAGIAAASPEHDSQLWSVTFVTERGSAADAAPISSAPPTVSVHRPAPRTVPIHPARTIIGVPRVPPTITVTHRTTTPPAASRTPSANGPPSSRPTSSRPTSSRPPAAAPTQRISPTITTLTIRHVSLDGATTSDELVPVTVTAR